MVKLSGFLECTVNHQQKLLNTLITLYIFEKLVQNYHHTTLLFMAEINMQLSGRLPQLGYALIGKNPIDSKFVHLEICDGSSFRTKCPKHLSSVIKVFASGHMILAHLVKFLTSSTLFPWARKKFALSTKEPEAH